MPKLRFFFTLILSLFFLSSFAKASEYNFDDVYSSNLSSSTEQLYIMHFALRNITVDDNGTPDNPDDDVANDHYNKGVATMIVGPSGKMMIFDVGRCPADADDISEKAQFILDEENSSSPAYFDPNLENIIISHDHSDHNGEKKCGETLSGLDTLTTNLSFDSADVQWPENFTPGETWVFDKDSSGYPVHITVVSSNGYIFGNTNRFYESDEPNILSEDPNTTSVVLLITYKNFAYFIGGDLTGGGHKASDASVYTINLETTVGAVITDFINNGMDVVQINHHGSSTSSNTDFLASLFPDSEYRNAIINVNDGYTCLPEADTVDRILDYITRDTSESGGNTHLWQTLEGGDGTGKSCDGGVRTEVNAKHSIENKNIWLLTDGETYSIRSVANSGHKHTYDVIDISTGFPDSKKTLIKNQAARNITATQPWSVIW